VHEESLVDLTGRDVSVDARAAGSARHEIPTASVRPASR
jgi:hypothetical protein